MSYPPLPWWRHILFDSRKQQMLRSGFLFNFRAGKFVWFMQSDELREGSSKADDADRLNKLQYQHAISSLTVMGLRMQRALKMITPLVCMMHQDIFLTAVVKVSESYLNSSLRHVLLLKSRSLALIPMLIIFSMLLGLTISEWQISALWKAINNTTFIFS